MTLNYLRDSLQCSDFRISYKTLVANSYGLFLIILVLLLGCNNQGEDAKTILLLEDILFINSDQINPLGRIYSISAPLQDHGFELAKTDSFNNIIQISLGPRKTPGLFTAEYDSLEQETKYYYRAYALTENQKVFSTIRHFHTFRSNVDSISAHYGNPGEMITIMGSNFTKTISVFFGSNEAKIINRIADIRIDVLVPKSRQNLTPIIIKFDDYKLLADTFEYITGKWTQLEDIKFENRYNAIQFQSDTTYTVLFGASNYLESTVSTQINTLSLSSSIWASKSLTTLTPLIGAFYTPSGYFGSGSVKVEKLSESIASYYPFYSFYKYDGASFHYLGEVPFTSHLGVGFEIRGTVFYAGGYGKSKASNIQKMYSYTNSTWKRRKNLPFIFNAEYPYITFKNTEIFINPSKEVWMYDPSQENFIQIGQFPYNLLEEGTIVNNDGNMYVGLDHLSNKMYRMEISISGNNKPKVQFIPKTDFPGNVRYRTELSYVYSGKTYYFRAQVSSNTTKEMELWMFEPNEFPD